MHANWRRALHVTVNPLFAKVNYLAHVHIGLRT